MSNSFDIPSASAFTSDEIGEIACAAYEANRQYCLSLQDNSQPSWHKAPQWQKDSVRNGVRFMLDNGFPSPEESHNNWMRHMGADGWVHGPEKDPEAKMHPCMVPYSDLPASQQKKDVIFRDTCISVARRIMQSGANKQVRADKTPAGTGPSITKESINKKVVKVGYVEHGLMIWCVIHMQNGFKVTGKPAACVSPENFNREKGQSIAYENAYEQIWALEGYLLAEDLYRNRKQAA